MNKYDRYFWLRSPLLAVLFIPPVAWWFYWSAHRDNPWPWQWTVIFFVLTHTHVVGLLVWWWFF